MPGICFQTDEFSTTPEGDLDLCNGQPGSQAAAWAREALINQGYQCQEPLQEDYGWGFWLEHPCMIWIAVSYAGGEQNEAADRPEWWINVSHETPIFAPRQWFQRKLGRKIVAEVFAIIEQRVKADPAKVVQQVEPV